MFRRAGEKFSVPITIFNQVRSFAVPTAFFDKQLWIFDLSLSRFTEKKRKKCDWIQIYSKLHGSTWWISNYTELVHFGVRFFCFDALQHAFRALLSEFDYRVMYEYVINAYGHRGIGRVKRSLWEWTRQYRISYFSFHLSQFPCDTFIALRAPDATAVRFRVHLFVHNNML